LDEQLWHGIVDRKEDIARIATHGPSTDDDEILIKAVFSFIMGRISKAEYDLEQEEEIE
jgi:hypothetical protein